MRPQLREYIVIRTVCFCCRNQVHTSSTHAVDEVWQRSVSAMLGLQFVRKTRVRPGGPNVPLTPPDMRTVKHITGDGNCLFRSFAYIMTGSEDQHMAVHTAILQHMINVGHFSYSTAYDQCWSFHSCAELLHYSRLHCRYKYGQRVSLGY